MASVFSLFSLFFLFNLVTAELLLEDGYVVTTVLDGHKSHVNPYTVRVRSGSSDLIILDSSGSSFYTVSLPLTEESTIKRLAGDGTEGNLDGESGQSRFNKPRSFAVDAKGNVYVADKKNKAIRKISYSGAVTTIAGGVSKEWGHRDGPAQNATFSDDFDISFVPQGCLLLVSDHGNQLVRQINLKEEDCVRSSHSNVGTVSAWAMGLFLACLLGVAIGIVVRPYVIPREGSNLLLFTQTWKLWPINQGKQAPTLFSDIRNGAAKFTFYSYSYLRTLSRLILSQLSLMVRLINVNYPVPPKKTVSLLDSDNPSSSQVMSSQKIFNDLKDLISFDNSPELSNVRNEKNEEEESVHQEKNVVSAHPKERIDRAIQAHIDGFAKVAKEKYMTVSSSSGSSGLVKRR